jgi:hypothetical protein
MSSSDIPIRAVVVAAIGAAAMLAPVVMTLWRIRANRP